MTEPSATETPALPGVYDHLRPAAGDATHADVRPGVYRVVGTSAGAVTLLRVADAEGRRRNTGVIVSVPNAALAAFEPAPNPDEDRSLGATLASQLDGFWWSLRLVGRTVVERPVPSAVALALVAVGSFGDAYLSIPDYGDTLLFLVGAFSLLYLTRRG